jgi:hypothetical protein
MVGEKLVSEKPMFIAALFILENWCKIAPKELFFSKFLKISPNLFTPQRKSSLGLVGFLFLPDFLLF